MKTAKKRGIANLSKARRIEIASMGGKAVSQKKGHMAKLGRKGGTQTSKDVEFMAKIGRKGGIARHA